MSAQDFTKKIKFQFNITDIAVTLNLGHVCLIWFSQFAGWLAGHTNSDYNKHFETFSWAKTKHSSESLVWNEDCKHGTEEKQTLGKPTFMKGKHNFYKKKLNLSPDLENDSCLNRQRILVW